MKKLLSIFFLFYSFQTIAQKQNIDSLWNIWKNKSITDSIKFIAITKIIDTYNDNSPDSVFYYAQLKYDFAIKKRYKKEQAEALGVIGRTHYSQGENAKAMEYFDRCLKIYQSYNDSISVSIVYNDIGNVYIEQGYFQKALTYYLKSLKINEETNDKKRIAISYMNIGGIYYMQKNNELALANYFKSLKYNLEIDRKNGIADCYINISATYTEQKRYIESIDYILKAIKIQEEIADELGLMYSYNNLGSNYASLNKFDEALTVLLKSEKIGIKKRYKPTLCVCYANLGDIYLKQNKLDKAYSYLTKALEITKEIEYKEYYKEIYHLLSQYYEKKGDYKQAYSYQLLFTTLKDTLSNDQLSKQINEMNVKYETEKKEKEIAILTKDKQLLNKDIALQESKTDQQKLLNYIFIGVLVVSLAIAFILYNRYNTNQKLNTQLVSKNKELSQKNVLIENQKEKIIDNITYAKRIQQSILMDEKEIQSYLPNSFIYYLPKDIVSGDFYWCSKIGDNIILAAIDCTGHGVSGAFMSMIGNTLLNQIVNEKHITTPSEILRLLNIGIFEGMNQGKEQEIIARDGMDIALCSINYKTNQLQFAGAQNPLYIFNKNQLEIIKGDMYSIGGGEINLNPYKQSYTNHIINISPTMTIYIFSDGFMDQFGGANRKKFGMQRFKELIITNQHLTMQKQKKQYESSHIQWKGKEQQIDDVLVIGVQL